jgi:hypothetical protein
MEEHDDFGELDVEAIRRMSKKQLQKLLSDNHVQFNRRDTKETMVALAVEFYNLDENNSDGSDDVDASVAGVHDVLARGTALDAVAAVENLVSEGNSGGVAAADVDEAWCVEDIDAEITLIQKMHLVETTRVSYKRCQKKFTDFIREHHGEIMLDPVKIIADVASLPSLVFKEFIMKVCRKRNKAGEVVKNPKTKKPMLIAFDSIAQYRKALFNIFVENAVVPSAEFVSDIKLFFKGLKRLDAREKDSGVRAQTEGKKAMPFAVYVRLQEQFYKEGKFFEMAYTSLTWNLMCRTDNTARITLKHLGVDDDAITVLFNISKTHQEGDEFEQKRRCYMNSRNWRLCLGFALGQYLMTVPELGSNGDPALFPGKEGTQKKRYSESLQQTLRGDEMKEFLASHGHVPSDFGAHSLRKGAATYVTSGSTGGPSIVAVCQRAGWHMGNVLDRYLKFDGSGDAFVGRVLAGLPLNLVSFADLPPHIPGLKVDEIEKYFPAVKNCPEIMGVAAFGLACVAHHECAHKCSNCLPEGNVRDRLMQSIVMANRSELTALFLKVVVGLQMDESKTTMRTTGVPPNIGILRGILKVTQEIESFPDRMLLDIGKLLDERSMLAPHVTSLQLRQELELNNDKMMKKFQEAVAQINGVRSELEKAGERLAQLSADGYKLHWWSRTPDGPRIASICTENFKMPKGTVHEVWRQWWVRGEDADGAPVPPLKCLVVKGVNHLPRDQHARWSEYNNFFLECEGQLPAELKSQLHAAYKAKTVDIALTNTSFKAITPIIDPFRTRGDRVNVGLKLGTVLRARAVQKAMVNKQLQQSHSGGE